MMTRQEAFILPKDLSNPGQPGTIGTERTIGVLECEDIGMLNLKQLCDFVQAEHSVTSFMTDDMVNCMLRLHSIKNRFKENTMCILTTNDGFVLYRIAIGREAHGRLAGQRREKHGDIEVSDSEDTPINISKTRKAAESSMQEINQTESHDRKKK